jgi:hypothetical protein
MLANRSNAARTLTIATLVWLIAILYCKVNFYRDPGSTFFDENRAFARVHSAYREEQSVEFLERFSEHPQKASASPSMCAVFLSVKRAGEQPLDVSIGSRAPSLCHSEWRIPGSTFLGRITKSITASYRQCFRRHVSTRKGRHPCWSAVCPYEPRRPPKLAQPSTSQPGR